MGRLFAELEQGQLEYSFDPELDFIITKGRKRKPVLVGEVKWGRYDNSQVRSFEAKVEDLSCRKVFITKRVTGRGTVGEVELMGAEDIVRLVA